MLHALPPFVATCLFVAAVMAGHRYRKIWKTKGPRWQLWVFGTIACVSLLVLGFVPLEID